MAMATRKSCGRACITAQPCSQGRPEGCGAGGSAAEAGAVRGAACLLAALTSLHSAGETGRTTIPRCPVHGKNKQHGAQ